MSGLDSASEQIIAIKNSLNEACGSLFGQVITPELRASVVERIRTAVGTGPWQELKVEENPIERIEINRFSDVIATHRDNSNKMFRGFYGRRRAKQFIKRELNKTVFMNMHVMPARAVEMVSANINIGLIN